MKIWTKVSFMAGVVGWALTSAWGQPAPEVTGAIQAIQQAPDPSAAVAAYANGVTIDRNDPKLDQAYVSRMVDLGLPEMAYHQALTLTSHEPNNGLAWGVVAYVDARRGQMPDAVSAINLAGQFASENLFVQRTAGEILAWYDTKADKMSMPDNAKDGLARTRSILDRKPAFIQAYNTAKNAYEAQEKAAQNPTQTPPAPYGTEGYPSGYNGSVPPPSPPSPEPDYYYDWGSTWIEPAPWYWWYPVGCFVGFDFFPFSTVVVFDHHRFFEHNHFFVHDRFHGHDFFHNSAFHHGGVNVAFHDPNRAFFHRDGQPSFFGTTPRPNTFSAFSARSFHTAPNIGGVHPGASFREPAGAAPRMVAPPAPSSHGMSSGGFHGSTAPGGSAFHSGGGTHGGGGFHGGGGGGGHGGGGGRGR